MVLMIKTMFQSSLPNHYYLWYFVNSPSRITIYCFAKTLVGFYLILLDFINISLHFDCNSFFLSLIRLEMAAFCLYYKKYVSKFS